MAEVESDKSVKIAEMCGPYEYTTDEIENRVIQGLDGNYRTGYINEDGRFVPKYVGRGCIYDRLKKHLDEGFKDTHFKFAYESNPVKSYQVESEDYHRFASQLRNDIHPRKPDGKPNEKCPCCGQ